MKGTENKIMNKLQKHNKQVITELKQQIGFKEKTEIALRNQLTTLEEEYIEMLKISQTNQEQFSHQFDVAKCIFQLQRQSICRNECLNEKIKQMQVEILDLKIIKKSELESIDCIEQEIIQKEKKLKEKDSQIQLRQLENKIDSIRAENQLFRKELQKLQNIESKSIQRFATFQKLIIKVYLSEKNRYFKNENQKIQRIQDNSKQNQMTLKRKIMQEQLKIKLKRNELLRIEAQIQTLLQIINRGLQNQYRNK